MKKLSFVIVSGILIAFGSCSSKKDWNCTCNVSSSLGSANQAHTLLQLTEDEVKAKCDSKVLTGNSSGACKYAAK